MTTIHGDSSYLFRRTLLHHLSYPHPHSPVSLFIMGFLSSVVMGSSAFILGMVFVCQVVSSRLIHSRARVFPREISQKTIYADESKQVDIPLLYTPVTDQALENAYTFYTIWFESPGAVKVSSPFSQVVWCTLSPQR